MMTIKELRERSGLSQLEAAKKLRINTGFWCRMELGQLAIPPKHFRKVSKLFKVPIKRLVEARIDEFAKKLKAEAYGQ